MRSPTAAGGRTADADLSAINLATRVKDEDHWYFPRIGDQTASVKVGAADRQGKIDLNSAAPKLLQTLPGIGEVKALAIVQHREAHGPFASVDAVVDVQGIGASTLTAIRDLVEVR
mgnify:FL=1